MSKDNACLADILKAGKAIQRFVEGVSREEFLANEEKYEAVNRKFEIHRRSRAPLVTRSQATVSQHPLAADYRHAQHPHPRLR
jgi:hypothetical protein